MNKISRNITENERSQAWLARKLGVSQPKVFQWCQLTDSELLQRVSVAENMELNKIGINIKEIIQ